MPPRQDDQRRRCHDKRYSRLNHRREGAGCTSVAAAVDVESVQIFAPSPEEFASAIT